MAYKIWNLFSSPVSHFASSMKNLTEGLPITKIESIVLVNIIGRGGFGQVSLYKKNGELLVLKEMLDTSERCQRLFLKEARILNMLNHKNIVRFHSLGQGKEEPIKSFLLEYVQFVFPFGYNESVSSLQDFLSFINEFNCVNFEHLQNFIARDICAGLAYLHERDIAHRDLKPGNVLVSNQHYSSLSGQEFEIMWRTQPVIAKLTDFGESRAALVQTNNVLHTHTNNIFRGTTVYMAPEILKHADSNDIRLEELKNMDIWSYAMVLFMLLNPDLRHPYELELKGCASNGMVPIRLLRLFEIEKLPCDSTKYDSLRKSHWDIILEAYRFCAQFTSRPTAKEALSLIESLLDRKRFAATNHKERTISDQRIGDDTGLLTESRVKKDTCKEKCLSDSVGDKNEVQTVKATSAIYHLTDSDENQETSLVAEFLIDDDAKTQKHPVSCDPSPPEEKDWLDRQPQILASLYGQCVGDAIGLLSEFMNRQQAEYHYKPHAELEYHHKYDDFHRSCWAEGDWTDDSDQMILIMESLTKNNGLVVKTDFAHRMVNWMNHGFQDLGDRGGIVIGSTTLHTLRHKDFLKDPHKVAEDVWIFGKKDVAPNGGVMRTSILGIHDWWNTDQVVKNALEICKTTHRDPRCQASAVSVCVAISLMLQRKHYSNGEYNIPDLIKSVYNYAKKCLHSRKKKKNLKSYLECVDLSKLDLDDAHSIGYTYKCLGAGFWALKQNNFRDALQQIVMHAGDADTNGAVAGALLGCKLGHFDKIPNTWLSKLKNKDWLDGKIEEYFVILKRRYLSKDTHEKDANELIA